jgi:hypothetical protein
MAILLRKEAKIAAALFAGFAVMTAIDLIYLTTMGGFPILHGIPTPSGAPFIIGVLNMSVKSAWSALAYGLVMRACFGHVRLFAVVQLWILGLVTVFVLGGLAIQGLLAPRSAGLLGLLAYFAVGWLVVRDRPSRQHSLG